MRLLRRLLDRWVTPPVPPVCPACRNTTVPIEPVGPDRFFCAVCATDFAATRRAEGGWAFDLTPLRYRQRDRIGDWA